MTNSVSQSDSSKKRRIMIITADESIIDQIQNNSVASIFKSIILDPTTTNVEVSQSSTKKSKTNSLTCVVCGSSANGYNFDAITCESCKAFFRRNALKSNSLECRRQGHCDINIDSRRRCSSCRLAKCFQQGMKRDRLLTNEQKEAKRQKIEENRNLTVRRSFDEKSPTVNNNEKLLSDEDLRRVETVKHSYEQRIELAERDGLPWNPSVTSHTLLHHLNSRSVSVMRLLSFFKQIPEFNELNLSDKFTLVKYNLMPLIILNCTLAYNSQTKEILENDFDVPINPSFFFHLHGQEIFLQLKKIFDSFVRIAQYDQRIIQLTLVVLILTKGFATNTAESEPLLNDPIAVHRAQNDYIELLWKYLETMFGRRTAIEIFEELVAQFVSWQTLQGKVHQRLQTQLSPGEIQHLLPIMRSLLHIPEDV